MPDSVSANATEMMQGEFIACSEHSLASLLPYNPSSTTTSYLPKKKNNNITIIAIS